MLFVILCDINVCGYCLRYCVGIHDKTALGMVFAFSRIMIYSNSSFNAYLTSVFGSSYVGEATVTSRAVHTIKQSQHCTWCFGGLNIYATENIL